MYVDREMPSGVVSCTEKFEEEEAREKELEELELVVDVLHVVSQVSSEVAGGLTTIVAARTITLQNKTKMRCARRCRGAFGIWKPDILPAEEDKICPQAIVATNSVKKNTPRGSRRSVHGKKKKAENSFWTSSKLTKYKARMV